MARFHEVTDINVEKHKWTKNQKKIAGKDIAKWKFLKKNSIKLAFLVNVGKKVHTSFIFHGFLYMYKNIFADEHDPHQIFGSWKEK